MTELVIPTHIPIARSFAAGMSVQCPGNVPVHSLQTQAGRGLTARDLSFALLALHFASLTERDPAGYFLLPDNGMRAALGLSRRDGIDDEERRWNRLHGSTLMLPDGSQAPSPTLIRDRGRAVRATWKGNSHWQIEDALLQAYRGREGEPVIYLPLRILQRAQSRTTILLAIRALAWLGGSARADQVVSRSPATTTVRLSLDETSEDFGLGDIRPSAIMTEHFEPAVAELDEMDAGIDVRARPRYAAKIAALGRRQRIRGFDISVEQTDTPRIGEMLKFEVVGWQKPPSFHHPKPVVVAQANVVTLRPRRSLGRPPTF